MLLTLLLPNLGMGASPSGAAVGSIDAATVSVPSWSATVSQPQWSAVVAVPTWSATVSVPSWSATVEEG